MIEAPGRLPRGGNFSLAALGVGARLAIAAAPIALIWVAVLLLVR